MNIEEQYIEEQSQFARPSPPLHLPKQYMVFGIKDFPEKDDQTEKDNPYLINSLRRAFQVAERVAEGEGLYARIVKIVHVETINNNCQH